MKKHGLSNTPEYWSWAAMRQRCRSTRPKDVEYYGARGVRVCAGWVDDVVAFVADMGPRPEGTSLDRRDGARGYDCGKCADCVARGVPANCRWATKAEQSQNRTHEKMTREDRAARRERLGFVPKRARLATAEQAQEGHSFPCSCSLACEMAQARRRRASRRAA